MAYFSYLTKHRPVSSQGSKNKTKVDEIRSNAKYDCAKCGLDKNCHSPVMAGVGRKDANIMIIGEAPTARGDASELPIAGDDLKLLRKEFAKIGIDIDEDVYITNAIKCKTVGDKDPVDKEIRCCNGKLMKEIEEIKPRVIIPMGNAALRATIGERGVLRFRGHHIPSKEFGYNCVIAPILNPSFVRWNVDLNIGAFRDDVKGIKKALKKKVVVKDYLENNTIVEDIDEFMDLMEGIRKNELPFALDWETQGFSPWNKKGIIVSGALATSHKHSHSFIMEDHITGSPWSEKEFKHIQKEFKRLLKSDCIKKFHNFKYEDKWAIEKLGAEITGDIRDVMYMSHLTREVKKTNSLDHLAFVYYGLRKLHAVDKYKKDMYNCPLNILHPYVGLDTKLTFRLENKLWKMLDIDDEEVYWKFMIDGGLATLKSEMAGAVFDMKLQKKLEKKYTKKCAKLKNKLLSDKRAKHFIKRHGKLDLGSSSKDMPKFLKEEFGIKVPKTDKGALSADDAFLQKYVDKHKFIKRLTKYRPADTLLRTFIIGNKECLHDDGLLHTEYGQTTTETGRLSSKKPNLQNQPNRKSKFIREMFPAPKGHVLMASDYTGIEVKGMAMVSFDKVLMKEINEDYDMHTEWGVELLGRGKTDEEKKEIRFQGKNGFVFPSYYGAGPKSIAKNMNLPEDKVRRIQQKFFKKYKGIKQFQEKTIEFYKKNNYVETLFGRKRHAPLTYNQIVNTPIQGLASDLCFLSMIELTKMGYKIPLMIHDDLTLYVPEDEIEETYEVVKEVMTGWYGKLDFVNVPLAIETDIGYDWYHMKPMAKFLN